MVLAPGAAYGKAKQWIPAHVARLIAMLAREYRATCVLVGSRADGKFIVVEKSPETTQVREPEGDFIVCANHFQTEALKNEVSFDSADDGLQIDSVVRNIDNRGENGMSFGRDLRRGPGNGGDHGTTLTRLRFD